MTFTIHGETPSKKNSRILNTKTKKSFPNRRYVEWHEAAVAEIMSCIARGEAERVPPGKRVALMFTFYHGDERKRDDDNQLSSVLDTLVDAGILADDKWKVAPFKFVYNDLDRENPRVEVCIEFVNSHMRIIDKMKMLWQNLFRDM